MRAVAVLPGIERIDEVVNAWKPAASGQDTLSVLVCSKHPGSMATDYPVHRADVMTPRPRSLMSLLNSVFGALPSFERIFWLSGVFMLRQADFQPGLTFSIRSLDPDVVDLRGFPWRRLVESRLRELGRFSVLSDGDTPSSIDVNSSWRKYDPGIKVSIVLPVYNGARFLTKSMETCLQQTHRNIELIVVDDGSTDATPEIVSRYVAQDPRVVSIRNNRNMRLPYALNLGFAHTTGELLTWTSCDNYYAPQAIEALVQYLGTWPDIDFVYSACRIVNESGTVLPGVRFLSPPWELAIRNVIGPYFLYRRAVYEAIGEFRSDMEYAEDYEYWVRVYKKFRMMRLHLPKYYYRHHSRSMTARAKAGGIGQALRERVRKEHFSLEKDASDSSSLKRMARAFVEDQARRNRDKVPVYRRRR